MQETRSKSMEHQSSSHLKTPEENATFKLKRLRLLLSQTREELLYVENGMRDVLRCLRETRLGLEEYLSAIGKEK